MDAASAAHPSLSDYLTDSADLMRLLAEAAPTEAMEAAVAMIVAALRDGRPLLVCGNGGSMADALHIAGELTARFLLERPGLPVIALGANPSTLTAWSNDVDYASHLAREVEAYGRPGGVLLVLSTSGNSPNIVAAVDRARTLSMTVVGMTGEGGGRLGPACDVLLTVPSRFTPLIQQAHQALYHYLCLRVESALA